MQLPPVIVPAGWVGMEPGRLDPAAALRALADAPGLACLHSGPQQPVWIGWGRPAQRLAGWTDLGERLRGAAAGIAAAPIDPGVGAAGWLPPAGGRLVQLDHEFPAGAGWIWAPAAWCCIRPDGAATLVAEDGAALAAARERLRRAPASRPPLRAAGRLQPDWDAAGHAERVDRLRAWIAAGDIYQANLTLGWRGRAAGGCPVELFIALMRTSPAARASLLRRGDGTIVCHSPETFLRLVGGELLSEPIKGTRPRDAAGAGRGELAASAKDHAELAMIIDLMRNDLGRCAAPGSVRVADAAAIVDLPHLHHLCGRIVARLRPGAAAVDAVRAAFPPGSVTGCPKRRALELIAAVEAGPRGPYCGAAGWMSADACDLAVAIRVAIADDGGGLRVHAGGGITADSDGMAEWREAEAKASALRQLLEEAG